ncbi:MAG: dicarboxylate/amino acid:cation symporter [Planctomycetota bacterium]|nr:MAG: dicarboxylate/amino acid:cation symporter [Planctomycetota bacterium]REJ96925.1 MAG: dicarboxylate/amino acid:cation symporter [Planctomycetota bacterium]REK26936.1 MAG: dicarboxylate/amino acid:cation symporter [Planctomycetota bacterium]REK35435.1 MAG: dicarboxylate/amino acid:cation symporter [Planctomycetota bacterium]
MWIVIAIVAAIAVALLLPVVFGLGISADNVAEAAENYPDVAALIADGKRAEARQAYIAHRAESLIVPLRLGGEIFLRVLKMIVVPLVVASVMTGILGMGDVRKLGRPGGYTLLYYLSTTVLAVIVGLILVNIIRPGKGMQEDVPQIQTAQQKLYQHLAEETDLSDDDVAKVFGDTEYSERKNPGIGRVLENLALMLFTDNLILAAAETQLLPLIVFSIVFAGLLTTMGERVATLTRLIPEINDALLALILMIMNFAPLGIFCLVAARFGEANAEGKFLDELAKTGWYSATVLIGLGIHAFVTLSAIYWYFTRKNPWTFIAQMSQALLTAFSTASSSATLPVTMESAVDRAGVSKKSVDFVLPLGATINMDGTALYEAVAAIFIAQVTAADMSFTQQIIVAATATLAAIGAAGIPEAGLVTMIIVLTAVGLPIEYITLILAVDWLLDRFRTTVNVFGDACGAAIIDRTMPPDEPPPPGAA